MTQSHESQRAQIAHFPPVSSQFRGRGKGLGIWPGDREDERGLADRELLLILALVQPHDRYRIMAGSNARMTFKAKRQATNLPLSYSRSPMFGRGGFFFGRHRHRAMSVTMN